MMIWSYWLSFRQSKTWPCRKAESSNILAVFALILWKLICFDKRKIAPAIHLFINVYSETNAHHSPIIYLTLKLLIKLHKEAGETRTHSVLLLLDSSIPPCLHYIDCHQHLSILFRWHLCWPNQSRNIQCSTHIPLLWAFHSLNDSVMSWIIFNVCRAIVFAVIQIIQVGIPGKSIFGVRNALQWTIPITSNWMTVDFS